MKVLLLQDVKGVGRRMEVKTVSDGYAKNFLFARTLAVPADEAALGARSDHDRVETEAKTRYETWARDIDSKNMEFSLATGTKGEVFGSVTAADIEEKIRALGIQHAAIELKKPIHAIGLHKVSVKFPLGIRGTATISVRGSR